MAGFMNRDKKRIGLKRPCRKCEKPFYPHSRFSRVCDSCLKKIRRMARKKTIEKNKWKKTKENLKAVEK